MASKSRKGLLLLTKLSTVCSFNAGFPHPCAEKARKRAAAPAFFLVQQPLLRAGAFLQRQALVSKLRVPFIPDANVGTDDFSAQGRRGFCDMQRLIAVEGYGQIRMGSTLGNLAGALAVAA